MRLGLYHLATKVLNAHLARLASLNQCSFVMASTIALALLILVGGFSWSAPATAASPSRAGAEVIFTRQNAPLGLSIDQFKAKYPSCDPGESGVSAIAGDGEDFPPLTGYTPAFTELLPTYAGSSLIATGIESAAMPNHIFPSLGKDNFEYFYATCSGRAEHDYGCSLARQDRYSDQRRERRG